MRTAARFAYIAVILFAAHFVTYFVPALRDASFGAGTGAALFVALLALAQHGVVFPVVAALPAPGWARTSAYVWLVGDMISDLMQLVGAPTSQYLTLRLIVNVLAAVWFLVASWRAPLAMRIVGIFVGCDLVAYSLTAPFDPRAFVLSLPSLILVPVWFALVGRLLMALGEQHATPSSKPSPAAAGEGRTDAAR